MLLGSYEKARQSLGEAVTAMEKQTPLNLIDFPRRLLSLGIVEQAAGGVDRAEALAKRCLALYQDNALPDDLTRGGIVQPARHLPGPARRVRPGHRAVSRREWPAAEKLGVAADAQQSNLLLNMALLHKAQGDLDEALHYGLRARELYQPFAEPESLEMAAFDAALANLHAARGSYREADALADAILRLCARHQIDGGPLVVTARHCQALYHLYRRQFGPPRRAGSRAGAAGKRKAHACCCRAP